MADAQKVGLDVKVQPPGMATLAPEKIEHGAVWATAVTGGERLLDITAFEDWSDFPKHGVMEDPIAHGWRGDEASFGIVDAVQPPGRRPVEMVQQLALQRQQVTVAVDFEAGDGRIAPFAPAAIAPGPPQGLLAGEALVAAGLERLHRRSVSLWSGGPPGRSQRYWNRRAGIWGTKPRQALHGVDLDGMLGRDTHTPEPAVPGPIHGEGADPESGAQARERIEERTAAHNPVHRI